MHQLEVPQPTVPPTPVVPDAPTAPIDPDPGTPAAPEEPATVPAPEEPATPIDPDPGFEPDPEPDPEPAEGGLVPRAHHDLCFGCGLANVFGLHAEVERVDGGELAARFFVKQDHQGFDGRLHRGVLLAALEEALTLAAGGGGRFLAEVHRSANVGTFVSVQTGSADDGVPWARAFGEDGELLAEAQSWPRT